MPTIDDPAVALLIELIRLGIELRVHGDRVRYRPRSALTPELAQRLKVHKLALMAILTAGDPDATQYTTQERRMLADAPAGLRATIGQIKAAWPQAEVVTVCSPRQHLADGIRDARRWGDHDRALNLRDAWRERAGIMEYDANLPRPQAEADALADTLGLTRTWLLSRK